MLLSTDCYKLFVAGECSANSGDGYCDSEISLDDAHFDNAEGMESPDHVDVLDKNDHTSEHIPMGFQQANPIDKLYLMQDSYFTQI